LTGDYLTGDYLHRRSSPPGIIAYITNSNPHPEILTAAVPVLQMAHLSPLTEIEFKQPTRAISSLMPIICQMSAQTLKKLKITCGDQRRVRFASCSSKRFPLSARDIFSAYQEFGNATPVPTLLPHLTHVEMQRISIQHLSLFMHLETPCLKTLTLSLNPRRGGGLGDVAITDTEYAILNARFGQVTHLVLGCGRARDYEYIFSRMFGTQTLESFRLNGFARRPIPFFGESWSMPYNALKKLHLSHIIISWPAFCRAVIQNGNTLDTLALSNLKTDDKACSVSNEIEIRSLRVMVLHCVPRKCVVWTMKIAPQLRVFSITYNQTYISLCRIGKAFPHLEKLCIEELLIDDDLRNVPTIYGFLPNLKKLWNYSRWLEGIHIERLVRKLQTSNKGTVRLWAPRRPAFACWNIL